MAKATVWTKAQSLVLFLQKLSGKNTLYIEICQTTPNPEIQEFLDVWIPGFKYQMILPKVGKNISQPAEVQLRPKITITGKVHMLQPILSYFST